MYKLKGTTYIKTAFISLRFLAHLTGHVEVLSSLGIHPRLPLSSTVNIYILIFFLETTEPTGT